jgi:hypothetical protein
MSIFLHLRAAVATSGAEPRAQAIALSSLFAAGALLLSISAIIGAIASFGVAIGAGGSFCCWLCNRALAAVASAL